MLHQEWSLSGLKASEISANLGFSISTNKKTKIAPGKHLTPSEVRAIWQQQGHKVPNQVISFQMLKGGVAKTSSALNIGIRAAQYGLKVLLVDLDQQANLSFGLGCVDQDLPVWVDIAEKKVSINKAKISVFENLDLIPSNLNNSVLEKVLMRTHRNWAASVRGPLEQIRQEYDWIIVDTAPSLSLVNTAVTCASDLVVLPVSPDPFAVTGLKKHIQELAEMQEEFELKKLDKKILFTRFDGREKLSQSYLDQVAELYPDELLDSYIRNSSDVKKAIEEGKHIYQNQSAAKEDYDLVTRELLGFLQGDTYAEC